jgi:flagellar hook assembly protein FlgD
MTTIRFDLPSAAQVSLKIYDLNGRLIRTLVNAESRGGGEHLVEWDGRDDAYIEVAAGVYIYRLSAGDWMETRRMTLVR